MPSFNKVILMGHLTRDPELKFTSGGKGIASFGIAVNTKYKQGEQWKDEACFVDVIVFGKSGEACAEHLAKGDAAMVEGRLKTNSWESNGQKRSKLEVIAASVQFLGKAGKSTKQEDIPF